VAERKLIAVTGATGAQGGGLVRAILDDEEGRFAARAVTRNADSPAAQELARRGAEVVEADLDDRGALARAFDGAWGAYCVTFFWNHFSPDTELAHARNLADAAAAAGVRHVIWSTLEDTRRWVPLADPRLPTLMERYKVPHFDAKGEADAFFDQRGIPTTYLLTSYYWENLLTNGPRPGDDGVLTLALPMGDARLPGIAAEDIGRCALGVFRRGDELVGRRVGIAGEHLSGGEMAAALSRALGRAVRYHAMPPDTYRSLGFPGAADLGNMFQFKRDFEADYRAVRDVRFARSLNPRLQGFDAWLAANAQRIQTG